MLFGRIFTEEDWRAAAYIALMFPRHEREPRARTVLLHAPQRGALIAIDRNGKRVKRRRWAFRNESDLPALGRAYRFGG